MVSPAPSLPKDFSQLSLTEAAELLAARKLPPVEQWHPERSGDSAMEIRAGGSWYHEGGRINRPAMVKLFSTILRRDPQFEDEAGRKGLIAMFEMLGNDHPLTITYRRRLFSLLH